MKKIVLLLLFTIFAYSNEIDKIKEINSEILFFSDVIKDNELNSKALKLLREELSKSGISISLNYKSKLPRVTIEGLKIKDNYFYEISYKKYIFDYILWSKNANKKLREDKIIVIEKRENSYSLIIRVISTLALILIVFYLFKTRILAIRVKFILIAFTTIFSLMMIQGYFFVGIF